MFFLSAFEIWISLTALLLGLLYIAIIRFLTGQWEKLPAWQIPPAFQPTTRISVLVPARNEAENILSCLQSLSRQDYPSELLEILLIDDHSSDATAERVAQYPITGLRLLQLTDGATGKKAALSYGIQEAAGELILTTDADCVLPPTWVSTFAAYFEEHRPAFITAPVTFSYNTHLLERFQALDMLGTMIVTGAGIRSDTLLLSNGANLAYPRKVFQAVGGFAGIDHLASGDDMLLMHKIAKAFPGRLAFLKSPAAAVRTPAVPGLRAFIRQRLRWATKSNQYQDRRIVLILGFVFLLCWGILLSPVLVFFGGWSGLLPFAILYICKAAADYHLLRTATGFFRERELLRLFWSSQWLHTLYIAVIGLLASMFRTYEWKGRRLR